MKFIINYSQFATHIQSVRVVLINNENIFRMKIFIFEFSHVKKIKVRRFNFPSMDSRRDSIAHRSRFNEIFPLWKYWCYIVASDEWLEGVTTWIFHKNSRLSDSTSRETAVFIVLFCGMTWLSQWTNFVFSFSWLWIFFPTLNRVNLVNKSNRHENNESVENIKKKTWWNHKKYLFLS